MKTGTKRKMLNAKDYVKIANVWFIKTLEQLADEVGVSVNTIRKAGAALREKDPSLCQKSKKKERGDIAAEAIQMLKNQAA